MTPSTFGSDRRATSPVVGVALLVLVTAMLAAAVGTAALGTVPAEPPPQTGLSLSVEGDRLRVVHRAGDTLDVRDLEVRLAVNGTPLSHQPPVPFFAAEGFVSGPTGPFNRGWTGRWSPGTSASLALAGTNTPVEPGDEVRLRLWVDDRPVADCSTTATAS